MIRLKGFTLLELLIVIAIIGILVSAVVVSLSGSTGSAEDAIRKKTVKSLVAFVQTYTYSSQGGGIGKLNGICGQQVLLDIVDKYPLEFFCSTDDISRFSFSLKLIENDSDGKDQYIVLYDAKTTSDRGLSSRFLVLTPANSGDEGCTINAPSSGCKG